MTKMRWHGNLASSRTLAHRFADIGRTACGAWRVSAIFVIGLVWANYATAQPAADVGSNAEGPSPACAADAGEMPVQALYGIWQVRLGDIDARVALFAHPEYEGSVRGRMTQGGRVAELAGDIDDEGTLTLDESANGRDISAVWSATFVAGGCGRLFEGTRRDAQSDTTQSVMLRKTGDGR
ncbi:MAG: hypothetical protein ABIW85_08570 [Variovorax sp.]